jgi:hypothetical protein
MLLIIFLLRKLKYIEPLFKELLPLAIVLLSVVGTALLQMYVVDHLPLADCLPYKKGNNILELRKMPPDAVMDKKAYSFVYKKATEKKEFTADNLPDSTWEFVERKETILEKGRNNVPKINDFSLADLEGNDSTEAILNKPQSYLFFIKELIGGEDPWLNAFSDLHKKATKENIPIYIITADKQKVNEYFNQLHDFKVQVFTCDGTAIKTAARANPTLFKMKGPVVQDKFSWADLDDALK